MATYYTDLFTIKQIESAAADAEIVEFTGATAGGTGGNAGKTDETDFYIQGTQCVSKNYNATGVGGYGVDMASPFTLAANGAIYVWTYWAAPNSVATKANGGTQIHVGQSPSGYRKYHVDGSDTQVYGGWKCYPVDPAAASNGVTSDEGTVGTTLQAVGWAANNVSAISKGNPYGLDAIRYGRGTIAIDQSVESATTATFEKAAEYNDKNDTGTDSQFVLINSGYHRLGIFRFSEGAFNLQGRILFGQGSNPITTEASGTLSASPCTFVDSNRFIIVQESLFCSSGFNAFEIQNTSSSVTWNSITVKSLSAVAKGDFTVTDNATVNLNTCTFIDTGNFIFKTNTTADECTFRGCGQITQGGSTITDCTISETTADVAVVVSGTNAADVQNITGCTFVGDNTSHAVNLGTITTNSSISWNNEYDTTTYATTNQAQNATSNPGDSEVILVNVNTGVTLTINVAATVTNSPTYRNTGPGTVLVVVSYDFIVRNIRRYSELRIFREENDASKSWTEIAGVETLDHPTSISVNNLVNIANTADGTFFRATYQHDGSWGNTVIVVMGDPTLGPTRWQYYKADYELSAANESFQVQQIIDRNKI